MLFNSFAFAVLFVVVYSLYLATMRRLRVQNLILLAASYFFYGWWDWRFLGLLFASTIFDFTFARVIDATQSAARRHCILVASVVMNLGFLGFFKYFNFFSSNAALFMRSLGFEASAFTLEVTLPLGISFYVFQSMSYVIDVYRRDLKPCRSFFDFALFVSFFPQLVAGPIERATNLLPQITRPRRLAPDQVHAGIFLIFAGLYKKLVIADNLAPIADAAFGSLSGSSPASPPGLNLIVGAMAFTFQIYGDFSGYSDMARGLAKVMGFDLMLNFRLPYFALSPSDFWRRWHISLSTWLRDYLYVPLGGNRGSRLFTARNMLLTMLLGGLWHGAAWNFVLWGTYHGALLVLYRLLAPNLGIQNPWRSRRAAACSLAQMAFMFLLTVIGWVLFRSKSFDQILCFFSHLRLNRDESTSSMVRTLLYCAGPLVAFQVVQYSTGNLLVVLRWPLAVRVLALAFLISAALAFGVDAANDFIYFQF